MRTFPWWSALKPQYLGRPFLLRRMVAILVQNLIPRIRRLYTYRVATASDNNNLFRLDLETFNIDTSFLRLTSDTRQCWSARAAACGAHCASSALFSIRPSSRALLSALVSADTNLGKCLSSAANPFTVGFKRPSAGSVPHVRTSIRFRP